MSVRYLLDSDICIYAMKRQPRLVRRFDTLAARCALSIVSYGELCFGQAASKRPIEAGAHLAALLETIQVLPMPVEAAAKYGDIRAQDSSARADRLEATTSGSPPTHWLRG